MLSTFLWVVKDPQRLKSKSLEKHIVINIKVKSLDELEDFISFNALKVFARKWFDETWAEGATVFAILSRS